MNTTKRKPNASRGFLDLAMALYLAAVSVAPLVLALALDVADTLPGCPDYPPSLYSR